jgi:Second Messenger Oligonucleotide or Dinucleotide Synthetase domain
MPSPRELDVNELLSNIAEVLDIPDHYYEDAVRTYEEIGSYLAQEDSPLRDYSPDICPQGSFRLGTVVRPHLKDDEYDIDLVCSLSIKKESITQKDLKKKVGERLKSRSDLKHRLDELGRCWRLSYAHQFHMDVLPVIPDLENPHTGILLTDKDLRLWQKSDPVAYAEWFYERMRVVAEQKRAAIAEEKRASIEDVPDWQVRTTLQRVVQLLKRHRDIYFGKDFEGRPTSILVTTLAAHAYRNQPEISEAINEVVREMAHHIENRKGVWWVENPVQPDENFADKWNAFPE